MTDILTTRHNGVCYTNDSKSGPLDGSVSVDRSHPYSGASLNLLHAAGWPKADVACSRRKMAYIEIGSSRLNTHGQISRRRGLPLGAVRLTIACTDNLRCIGLGDKGKSGQKELSPLIDCRVSHSLRILRFEPLASQVQGVWRGRGSCHRPMIHGLTHQ